MLSYDERYGGTRDAIATRFQLFHEDEEVGRCHMCYKDGSWDPSLGPTIETIAVKESRRGEGLAIVLWYFVRRFIEQNFTLECLNNDAPLKHIMVKATEVTTTEVEVRYEKDGTTRRPVTFKELLFDFSGFSVRELKGGVAMMMSHGRIKDEEAVLYIPLLASRDSPSPMKQPKVGRGYLRAKQGSRMCQWCTDVGMEKLRCTRCQVAFYCSPRCQKKDWKRHKKWCNKSREEVWEALRAEGHVEKFPDGTESLVIKGLGM